MPLARGGALRSLAARDALERFEGSPVGRALISAFLGVTLAAVAITNLPASNLRAKLMDQAEPYLDAVGVDQNWGVFAPDPRRQVLGLEARLRYRDGSTETWRPPTGGALVGAYWDYRWQKLAENVLGGQSPAVERSVAEWAARHGRRGRPVRVTLVKLSYDLVPPGKGASSHRPFSREELLTIPVGASR